MNVGQAAHLSGQMSGQGGVGVGGADGPPQHQPMQDALSLGGIDAQFVLLRNSMRQRISEYIGRKQSSAEWRRRLPELARRLEEILFRKFSDKNDYNNMMTGPIEPQLQFAIKTLSAQNQQNHQTPRQTASSCGYGTMIPTPESSSRIAYAGAGHLKRELYQINETLEEPYLEVLSDLYEMSKQIHVDNHNASQNPTNQHEEVKSFKSMLERSLHSLQINKSCDPGRQMISIINSEKWMAENIFQQSAGQLPALASSSSGTRLALGMLSTEESDVKKA